ncbi:protease [Candidimonas sp. SYP-B2681]|nr:protease [Candidimonas sp. SYP-B2681]
MSAQTDDDASRQSKLPPECAIVFESIGVAVVRCAPATHKLIDMAVKNGDGTILAIEPERRVYAIGARQEVGIPAPVESGDAPTASYLKGYRDAVNDLVDRALARHDVEAPPVPRQALDETAVTWGVQATRSDLSSYTGKGVRLAVLDTGLDLKHPDFSGRRIEARSFVEGEPAQDGNGHGTHCVGIAAGPESPGSSPRYGVASEAELFIGKVLGNQGAGSDGGVLDGINWAVENKCQIVSMSLGSTVATGETYSTIFEEVAKRALTAGTVIIAAAGNDSERPESIAPVSHPANCPSILAVAAVDRSLDIAPFSCGGLVPDGGQVDVAAPGVAIFSSWPAPRLHNTISGTSMATPFVAGITALHAQAHPETRGRALLNIVLQNARRLPLPSRDVGAGLIQAP